MAPAVYIGCGCVVVDDRGRYLLVEESKAIARGRMALPAGKLEANESLDAAACREVLEETGLIAEIDGLLGVYHCAMTSEGSFGVNFVYLAHVTGGAIMTSAEHPVVGWFDVAEIRAFAAEGRLRGTHVLDAIDQHRSGVLLDTGTVTEVVASGTS